MNKRQRLKCIPSIWIIAEKKQSIGSYYSLYAIDWKRGGRFSWEGWEHLEDLLQFHILMKRKAGARKSTSLPCAKVAKKARFLHLNEAEHVELEQMVYQPFSKKRWRSFISAYERFYKID
jgi:hypothetical protein